MNAKGEDYQKNQKHTNLINLKYLNQNSMMYYLIKFIKCVYTLRNTVISLKLDLKLLRNNDNNLDFLFELLHQN